MVVTALLASMRALMTIVRAKAVQILSFLPGP